MRAGSQSHNAQLGSPFITVQYDSPQVSEIGLLNSYTVQTGSADTL